MTRERADWSCPACDSSRVFRRDGSLFECQECGQETHERIGENADALEEIADSDLPAAEIADLLLSGGDSA